MFILQFWTQSIIMMAKTRKLKPLMKNVEVSFNLLGKTYFLYHCYEQNLTNSAFSRSNSQPSNDWEKAKGLQILKSWSSRHQVSALLLKYLIKSQREVSFGCFRKAFLMFLISFAAAVTLACCTQRNFTTRWEPQTPFALCKTAFHYQDVLLW